MHIFSERVMRGVTFLYLLTPLAAFQAATTSFMQAWSQHTLWRQE
jgi:hypothetical protein